MLVGNKDTLAIEHEMSQAFTHLGTRGLGSFRIHVLGMAYGVNSANATLLACSFDHVVERLQERGRHVASFSTADGEAVATAAWTAVYSEAYETSTLGLSRDELTGILHDSHIVWAPDGDAAFDDGSHILQFDIGEQVRVIGSRWAKECQSKPSDLRDLWLPADHYYDVLEKWRRLFASEWESAPKRPE